MVARSWVSTTKCGPLANLWGVTNSYGQNFQNIGSKMNQRACHNLWANADLFWKRYFENCDRCFQGYEPGWERADLKRRIDLATTSLNFVAYATAQLDDGTWPWNISLSSESNMGTITLKKRCTRTKDWNVVAVTRKGSRFTVCKFTNFEGGIKVKVLLFTSWEFKGNWKDCITCFDGWMSRSLLGNWRLSFFIWMTNETTVLVFLDTANTLSFFMEIRVNFGRP